MLVLLVAPGLAEPQHRDRESAIAEPHVDLLSDEDEVDDESPDQDPGAIVPTFVSEEIPPGVTDDYVALQSSSVDGEQIVLDVVVTEVHEPVSGIVLKLSYPAEFCTFVGCTDGEFFPPGPCFSAEPTAGEVLVAISVTSPDQATPVTGAQVIVRLEFAVDALGEGPIVIEGQNLGGGDASALLDVNGDLVFVQWFSGTLQGLQPVSRNW